MVEWNFGGVDIITKLILKNMKIGIIIYSNETEIVWNAFRLANFSLKAGDLVKIFLLSKGVEYEKLDSEKFNIKDQAKSFLDNGLIVSFLSPNNFVSIFFDYILLSLSCLF